MEGNFSSKMFGGHKNLTPPPRQKIPLVSMGGWAEDQACADPGARTPIGTSGILFLITMYIWWRPFSCARAYSTFSGWWNQEVRTCHRAWKYVLSVFVSPKVTIYAVSTYRWTVPKGRVAICWAYKWTSSFIFVCTVVWNLKLDNIYLRCICFLSFLNFCEVSTKPLLRPGWRQ